MRGEPQTIIRIPFLPTPDGTCRACCVSHNLISRARLKRLLRADIWNAGRIPSI